MNTIREKFPVSPVAGIAFAVIFVMTTVFLSSCEKKVKNEVVKGFTDPQTVPSLRSLDVTTLISDSGITRYRIKAKEWLMFENAKEPYWLFPKGIYVEKFDENFHVDAFIMGDTAIFYKYKQLWELKGDVKMANLQDEKFFTELLFWDQRKREIYSDSAIHIEKVDRIIEGIGFVSNEPMTQYTIRKTTGIFPMKSPADEQREESDSLKNVRNTNAQRYAPQKKGEQP